MQVGVLLNGEANPNRTRRHMRDVIELETRIAQITVSNAERRDEEKLYHNLTISDLHKLAPFVNYKFGYYNILLIQSNDSIKSSPFHVA